MSGRPLPLQTLYLPPPTPFVFLLPPPLSSSSLLEAARLKNRAHQIFLFSLPFSPPLSPSHFFLPPSLPFSHTLTSLLLPPSYYSVLPCPSIMHSTCTVMCLQVTYASSFTSHDSPLQGNFHANQCKASVFLWTLLSPSAFFLVHNPMTAALDHVHAGLSYRPLLAPVLSFIGWIRDWRSLLCPE